MTVCFIFTASAALTNVCIAFFTTPASVGQWGISGKYPISLALAEDDMLARNALNHLHWICVPLYLTNWCKVPCTIPRT